MLLSPYTPGELPRVLVGRARERERIRNQLGRVASFAEMAGPTLVLHAPRGFGKTSLLRHAEAEAGPLGFVCAWVACAKNQPLLPEIVSAVRHALETTDAITVRARASRATIDRLGVEVGLLGVTVSTDVGLHRTDPPAPGAVNAVETLLHDAATLVRDHGGAGLLVLLDELHAADFDELGVLLNALQNLAGRRADNPLAVMVAGLPSTPETMLRAATFGERSEFLSLDRFDDADSRLALVEPARAVGVTWSTDALARALDVAHGYPYHLQLIGDTTWRAAAPRRGGELDAEAVARGIPLMDEQLTAMSRARWDSAPPLEQEFLAAMAAWTEGDVVPRQFIAERMGRESRAISVPRARLIDRGVIEAAGRGRLRFTLPGMATWVRMHLDGD